jgi:hypothetical protein
MSQTLVPTDTLVAVQPAPAAPTPPFIIHDEAPPAEILVPITFFICVLGAMLAVLIFRYRQRKLAQEERLRAMELRMPIPPEPQRPRGNPFIMPMLLAGAGLGLLVLWLNLAGNDDRVVALAFGMISLLAGAGWFLAIQLNQRSARLYEKLAEQESQAYVEAMARVQGSAPTPPTPPAPPVPPAQS